MKFNVIDQNPIVAPTGSRGRGLRRIMAGALLALCVGGCIDKSTDDYVASAKRYIEKKDHNAATIELRNALQKSPMHAEARFLLGSALLEQGAAGTAEIELRNSIKLGRDGDDVQFALASALSKTGNAAQLIREFGSKTFDDPERNTSVRLFLGNAYLARGSSKEAASAFEDVLRAKPDHAGARMGQARLRAAAKDFAGAMKLTDSVLAASPAMPDALFFKAELQGAEGDTDGALRTLDALVKADPKHVSAHLARVQIQLTLQNMERASGALGELKAVAPTDPRTLYMEGLIAFRQGKPAEARESIAKVLNLTPDHVPSVLLAGLIAYQLHDYPAAEGHLRQIVSKAPNAALPRRVLAAVLLQSGQPEGVLETLRPLLDANDAGGLAIAGEAHLAMGDKDKALDSLQRSAKLDPKSSRVMTKLGETRLALGELDRAIGHLEAASTADRQAYRADLLLVTNYLKRGDPARALKAAAVLEDKQPKNSVTHTLIADVHFAAGDAKAARERLGRALEFKADYVPALAGLAKLDALDGNLGNAKNRYEGVLKRFPTNDGAWIGLVDVLNATGARPITLAATLEKAVTASPSSTRLQVALIRTYLRAGEPRAAIAAGRRADARFKDDPAVLEALGLAERAAGDGELALATFGRLVAVRPNAVNPLLRLAEAQLALKEPSRALATTDKAIRAAPNSMEAHRMRALLLVELERRNEALAATRAVQKRIPAEAAGYLMEGEVAARMTDWLTAEAAFRKAFAARKSLETVSALYNALERAGKRKDADTLARQWLQDNPKDVALRTVIGQRAIAEQNDARAAEAYREVVSIQPKNAVAWNNLAWVAMRQGDSRAGEYAERALALAPYSPQIKDTLGMILANKGETKRAIALLRDAASEAPDLVEIRMNLAKTLLKSGEKNLARKELEALAKQTIHAPSREEAQAMLGKI